MAVDTCISFCCPETFDISSLNSCHDQALTALEAAGATIAVDASAVSRIDAAALQWLIAFRRAALAGNGTFGIESPADCLVEAAVVLGLADELQLHSERDI